MSESTPSFSPELPESKMESTEDRPTNEKPHLFDTDETLTRVTFSQVAGETLQGVVTGYFYAEDGTKINLVMPTKDSAEKSGWDSATQGVMRVPEWALSGNTAEAQTEHEPLSTQVASIADHAIEQAIGTQNPESVVDLPSAEPSSPESILLKRVDEERARLKDIEEGLSIKDRTALRMYSNALLEIERTSQRNKMSFALINDGARIRAHTAQMTKLKDLEVKAGLR